MHFQKKDGYFSKGFHTKKEMGKMTSLGNKKTEKGRMLTRVTEGPHDSDLIFRNCL